MIPSLNRILIICIINCFQCIPANAYKVPQETDPLEGIEVLPDLSVKYPWLPKMPKEITPEMKVKLESFTKTYQMPLFSPWVKRSLNEAKVAAIEKKVADLGLSRNKDGKVVAKYPILFNGEHGLPKGAPKEARGYHQTLRVLLRELRVLYMTKPNVPLHDRVVEQLRICLEYVADQPWNSTSGKFLWIGNGYTTLHQGSGKHLTSLSHVLEPEARLKLLENCWWMFNGSLALQNKPSFSTDNMRNTIPQVFAAVAAMPDCPAKWQRILVLRRALDSAIIDHSYTLITPDGGVIHHSGFHNRYGGYSFIPLVNIYTKFSSCGFPGEHAEELNRRFRLAAFNWARITLGYKVIDTLCMRPHTPWKTDTMRPYDSKRTNPRVGRGDLAVAAAQFAEASGVIKAEDDKELAELLLAVDPVSTPLAWKEKWAAKGWKAAPLKSNTSLPVAGAQIHRRDGWVVVARGQNKYFRGGEGIGKAHRYNQWGARNTFASRFCAGSFFIADSGSPLNTADSGWLADGFNYSKVPGNTGSVQPEKNMVGSYFGGGDARLGGGCDLMDQGIWAYNPGKLRKSCFMIDDRITYITTGIGSSKGDLYTSISQSAEEKPLTLSVNGKQVGTELNTALDSSQPITLLDGRNRGYYIHPGGDAIRLNRGIQKWTYCENRFFDPKVDPKVKSINFGPRPVVYDTRIGVITSVGQINNKGNKAQIEGPRKLQYYKPSEQRYTTFGFEHGEKTTTDQIHAFTLLMKSNQAKLTEFADQMKSNEPPVKFTATNVAHTFYDRNTGFSGTCLFSPGNIPEKQKLGKVRAISRIATLLEKTEGNNLHLSIGSTDRDNSEPFIITIDGIWKLTNPTKGQSVEVKDGSTILKVPYKDIAPHKITLIK